LRSCESFSNIGKKKRERAEKPAQRGKAKMDQGKKINLRYREEKPRFSDGWGRNTGGRGEPNQVQTTRGEKEERE